MEIKYYYVYILKCNDGSYYVGFSNNPYRRLDEHNAGIHPKAYTFFKRPVTLAYCCTFSDPMEGIEFEKQLKGWSRKKKEALINGDISLLKKLSLSYKQIRFIKGLEELTKEFQEIEQAS